MQPKQFHPGDRVSYHYFIQSFGIYKARVKYGTFIRYMKSDRRGPSSCRDRRRCYVQVDGNKHPSRFNPERLHLS